MQASRLGLRLLRSTKCLNVIIKHNEALQLSKGGQLWNKLCDFSSHGVHSLVTSSLTSSVTVKYKLDGLPVSLLQKKLFSTTSTTNSLSAGDIKKAVDTLTEQFMEARELLDDARHSLGTVYFSDDMSEAQTALKETLKLYEDLLKQLSPEQKQDVVRTIGLKMEELKAQGQLLEDESLA